MKRVGTGVGLVALLCAGVATGADTERAATRQTMNRIFEAVRYVLPLSVDDTRFREAAVAPEIHRSLRLLTDNANVLAAHGVDADPGFEYLGASLAEYAFEADRRYAAGQFDSAKFFVQRLTDFCVACHSRLPTEGDSLLTQGFVTESQLAKLPPQQRAALQVATRQFEAALHTYEQLFADRTVHPAELVHGPLTDYLIVSIRVRRDVERPIPVLNAFAARPDLWRNLRADIEHWSTALNAVREQATQAASLDRGRQLVDQANRRASFPADRQALIYHILASGMLHRVLEAHYGDGGDTLEVAEAYYLLGLTELRIGRDFWLSQAQHYLETAIRLAPQTPFAQRAYALLEEETVLGYTGSSGVTVPDDVASRLEELRRLMGEKGSEPLFLSPDR